MDLPKKSIKYSLFDSLPKNTLNPLNIHDSANKINHVFQAVLRIHLILMRIRTGKKWVRIQVISLRFTEFLSTKNNFQIFVLFISLIFILKLDEPLRNEEIFIISKIQSWVLGVIKLFLQFLVDILPLVFGSVDPHIFADPEPGSQNLADPTDADSKHSASKQS